MSNYLHWATICLWTVLSWDKGVPYQKVDTILKCQEYRLVYQGNGWTEHFNLHWVFLVCKPSAYLIKRLMISYKHYHRYSNTFKVKESWEMMCDLSSGMWKTTFLKKCMNMNEMMIIIYIWPNKHNISIGHLLSS